MKYLIILTAFQLVSIVIVRAQATRADLGVVVEMMEDRKEEPTEFFQQLSNTTNYVSMLVPLSVLATGYARGEKTTVQKGWYIAESLAASSLITWGLKYTVKRSRPFTTDSYIVPASSGGGPSFPSGHT